MKLLTIHAADAALLLSLLFAPTAAMLRCDHIQADGQKFDLSKLGGPHSVVTSRIIGDAAHNTTYTVDICRALKKSSDVKKDEQCPNGSRVCAIKRIGDQWEEAIPIAGELKSHGGFDLDPEVTRLSTSDSNSDSQKQGVRVVMKGGFYHIPSGPKRAQRAIIEFICDEKRNGTEGEWNPKDDKYENGDGPAEGEESFDARSTNPLLYRAEDDGGDGGEGDGDDGDDGDDESPKEVQLGIENDPSLIFNSYEPMDADSNIDVLRLTWLSKYACEKRDDEGSDEKPSTHWGFFTWLVILVFIGTAAYLIFGSWLNYNRYGARGWDLLPHGDTIRDIPYLLKDWTRRVLNTVQGSGSRGGYSAV
ncbi:autophagy-related protein 27 [Hypoxylon cercidicola]|nr:autophagy-related protein 27 [Hypoxylon cercidicola]